MTRLLHISDLHFGTVQRPVADALRRLAAAQQPSVLVLSGDITQRARASEFAAARAFCDQLAVPAFLSVPGNHDIPLFNLARRALSPYSRYLAQFGPALDGVVSTPDFLVIGVNTARWWKHKNGRVSTAQIDHVAQLLRGDGVGALRQLRVVVVHQPIHVMRAEDEHDRLKHWAPAVRAWSQAGADVVLGGHIHLPYVCALSASTAGLAALSRTVWCVQAGTALSSRVRWEAPNSVNLLCFDRHARPPVCRVERWDFVSALPGGDGEFEQVLVTDLALEANPAKHVSD